MTDADGARLQDVGPSTPVVILGLSEVPPAGERFVVMPSDREARAEAERRRRALSSGDTGRSAVTLDSLFGEIHKGNVQDFNLVLKADVQGSLEPLVGTLEDLSVDEVNVKVIHASVGSITESDVQLAVASKGVIIGFNTAPEPGAKRLADQEGVEIREYRVIYDIVDDVERAVTGMLAPVFEERQDATIEVRQVFRVARRNAIAGAYVREGTVRRGQRARVVRAGAVLHEGELESLKRLKDDAREVASGFECGIQISGFDDFQEGDEILTFHMEQSR
jgi:translation initiation factor IF-2